MRQAMESLAQDLHYALRSFRRSPGFFAVAVLSLTLGIGATSSIFSVIHAVLINPYPYARPDEIWAPALHALDGRNTRGSYTVDEVAEIAKLPAFSDVMATGFETALLTGEFAPESFGAILLSGNAFNFLGVPPVAGRTIQPTDIAPSGDPEPVVVLSYRVWVRLFNGDPAAIGRTMRLNDRPHTVIGVMPPRFGWYGSETIWMPLPTRGPQERRVNPIVRLAPGATARAGEDQLQALFQRLAKENPSAFPAQGFTARLHNYMDITVASGEMRSTLLLLLGAVGFLLLIACANVANLQLARGTARTREMAVRVSIGAARRRVLRQLMTESVLLSMIGGAAGVLFAFGATKAIVALMPEFYVPNEARVTINMTVLFFSLAVSVLTGIVFGLVPALQASRPDLTDALKAGGRAGGASVGSRTRSVLVVVEVALSVVLLASAGLMVRTFLAIQQVDPGMSIDRVLMVAVPLPPAKYKTIEQRNAFAEQLLERVGSLPGVSAVALGNGGLPYAGMQSPFAIAGQPSGENRRINFNLISAGYLRTLGIPLRRGRALEESEIVRGDPVALINEAAARLWPAGTDPIGARLRLGVLERPPGAAILIAPNGSPDLTIVGIIGNTRNNGLRNEPAPVVLIPFTLLAPPQRILAVRSTLDPKALLNPVREQLRSLDRDQPLGRPLTLDELVGSDLVQPRFTMALFAFFAIFGLALAAAGLYSVLSFNVTRRTHEIGIRMALGARRADILNLMLTMGGRLVLFGVALGVPASLLTSRLLQNLLFGVKPIDAPAYVAVTLLLGVVALIASYLPARRAAGVDPMVALRNE